MYWLAKDFSALLADPNLRNKVWDVIVVGSGYGAAAAAAELAKQEVLDAGNARPVSVCVLERGREYLPGMFPSRFADLPGHIRYHRSASSAGGGAEEALLDVRIGPDVSVVVANGLGGGSLVNAGVMEIPKWSNFTHRMPDAAVSYLRTGQAMQTMKSRLGAVPAPQTLAKTGMLRDLGNAAFRPAHITIAARSGANVQGTQLEACTHCGDCMTGCNVGAKNSLDASLLAQARRDGAEIFTGVSVLRVERETNLAANAGRNAPGAGNRDTGARWLVQAVFTENSLRRRHGAPARLRARNVILAAGTLGSPEILMRSAQGRLRFSPRLGHQFSGNGDSLAAIHKTRKKVHTVAPETQPLDQRSIGPTITGIVDMAPQMNPARAANAGAGFLIQEFAVPAPLKRLFDEIVTTANTLHEVPLGDATRHSSAEQGGDPAAVDPAAIESTLLVGLIGHDGAAGVLRPPSRKYASKFAEGQLEIEWPDYRQSGDVEDSFRRLEELVAGSGVLGEGGRVLPNPLWRAVPDSMDGFVDGKRGAVFTVHPLGGCPMGDDSRTGVVDHLGRVFDPGDAGDYVKDITAVHDGLLVLDGSIVPASLGANPALTIACLSERGAQALAQAQGWTVRAGSGAAVAVGPRPRFKSPAECTAPARRQQTRIQVSERLIGEVNIRGRAHIAELTLHYRETPLSSLTASMTRSAVVVPDAGDPASPSQLRLFDREVWDKKRLETMTEELRRPHVVAIAAVDGTLRYLHRENSVGWWRALRALAAFFVNRGLRELLLRLITWARRPGRLRELLLKARDRLLGRAPKAAGDGLLKQFWRLATRAGEVRRFDYDLRIAAVQKNLPSNLLQRHDEIRGFKRITYGRRANPWLQLTRMRLTAFPGLMPFTSRTLRVDGRFMARRGVALLRITAQQDHATALAEFASLGLYFFRLLVNIHLWSFARPDPPRLDEPNRLPGKLPGCADPVITTIELDPPLQGTAVVMRLACYRHPNRTRERRPLLLLHGYSASGTSFAHPALPHSMAEYFSSRGRDVWIADLRTSAGLPTAVLPWTFEDVAFADIPKAVHHIHQLTGEKVDVFAHCIGAVMLSMAILSDPDSQLWTDVDREGSRDRGPFAKRYPAELRALPASIGKIVLSQKGPDLAYSEDNILRAFVSQMLRSAIPDDYQFRPPASPGLKEQLVDRFLSTLPYPDADYDVEHPFWLPLRNLSWVSTRHRMDALYARDFSAANVDRRTLWAIDDLFGPLNIETVSQALHFVRNNLITNISGMNHYVNNAKFARWPRNGTLSIHGEDNGLASFRTLELMRDRMKNAGVPGFRTALFPGFGHQDCLIGKRADQVFATIEEFLR